MIISVMISWMKIIVVLVGFFALSGASWTKRKWKHKVLTILMIILYMFLEIVPFRNPNTRYMMEVSVLLLYIVLYCQKEMGRHFMYLLIVYVLIDVAGICGGIVAYILQRCLLKETYQFLGDVTIVIVYASLIFVFLIVQKRPHRVPDKKGYSFVEAGITIVLLLAEGAVLAFIGSDEGSKDAYPFYAFSFLSALVIGALWIIDKRNREKQEQEQMQEFVRHEHRVREVLPTVERTLEKIGSLSENSEETAQIIDELMSVCRTDKEQIQAEIFETKTFMPTGSATFDSMLERILQETAQEGVDVEIIVRAKVSELLKEHKIEIGLLLQMFGDIYRNANKAVLKKGGERRILTCFGFNRSGIYEISVSDNGVPFPQYVLEHLGERGVTTDGTGHGLADVFSIMDKYGISFCLEQIEGQNIVYTKTIRLVFDGKRRREVKKFEKTGKSTTG